MLCCCCCSCCSLSATACGRSSAKCSRPIWAVRVMHVISRVFAALAFRTISKGLAQIVEGSNASTHSTHMHIDTHTTSTQHKRIASTPAGAAPVVQHPPHTNTPWHDQA